MKPLIIDAAKFPLELLHHDNFLELIVVGADDGRHVCDFMDSDSFGGEVFLLHF